MADVFLLIEVTLDEALHVSDAIGAGISAEDLQIDGREMMVGIGIELPLKLRQRLRLDLSAGRVGIGQLSSDAVDLRVHGCERSQHVIEGTVLHHENNDMTKLVQSWWHIYLPRSYGRGLHFHSVDESGLQKSFAQPRKLSRNDKTISNAYAPEKR